MFETNRRDVAIGSASPRRARRTGRAARALRRASGFAEGLAGGSARGLPPKDPAAAARTAVRRRSAVALYAVRLLTAAASAPAVLALAAKARPGRDACVALLCTYAAVAAVALATGDRRGHAARAFRRALPALDVLTFGTLLVAAGAFRGPLLVGFLFAVAELARVAGARTSVGVAAFVAACVTSAGFDPWSPPISVANATLDAEALSAFALAFACAWWASADARRARLPKFEAAIRRSTSCERDVDAIAAALAVGARDLFDADRALFVLADPDHERVAVYRAGRGAVRPDEPAERVAAELGERLLLSASPHALVFERAAPWSRSARGAAYDATTGRPVPERGRDLEALAGLLDAATFASVPVRSLGGTRGRLFVAWAEPRRVRREELFSVGGALGAVGASVEALRRAERAEAEAAERERVRIARDLHDTTVQSFVGIRIGLSVVQRKLAAGSTEVAGDVARLLALVDSEIGETRGYVDGLRRGGEEAPGLLVSVNRFVEKFRGSTGIDVSVRADGDVELGERLSGEVFRLVAEGLSNVRRHTRSRWAVVELRRSDARFDLRITNDASDGEPARPFTPRSIGERTAALGGDLHVSILQNGSTRLRVAIPLSARSAVRP